MTPDAHATLMTAYEQSHGKQIGPDGPGDRPAGPLTPVRPLETVFGTTKGGFGDRAAAVLRDALTPLRWEPGNPYNDHRAYPSARSAFTTDTWVRSGDGEARWFFDPLRMGLRPEHSLSPTAEIGGGDRLLLEIVLRPERLPSSYGTLRQALALLEAGHVCGAIIEAAVRHGLRATAERPAPDERAAVVIRLTAGGRTRPVKPPGRRSSGYGPNGLSADPRPLPAASVHTLSSALRDLPTGSPATWESAARIDHRLVLHNVDGLPDGLYALRNGAPSLIGEGPYLMDQVQAAFRYPPSVIDVASMNAAWVMTADVAAAVEQGGPDEYSRLLLTCGALAQHAGTAAAVAGLLCRPCRSVQEPELEAALGLPPGSDFLYLLLAGRPRTADFPYDTHTIEESK